MGKQQDIPRALFWDIDPARLDLQENKDYIIERTLEFGDDKAVKWLFLKSLVYFEDADREPDPEMLAGFSWTAVKRFFVETVGALSPV